MAVHFRVAGPAKVAGGICLAGALAVPAYEAAATYILKEFFEKPVAIHQSEHAHEPSEVNTALWAALQNPGYAQSSATIMTTYADMPPVGLAKARPLPLILDSYTQSRQRFGV